MVQIELIPASYTVCPNCDVSDEINGNFEEGQELFYFIVIKGPHRPWSFFGHSLKNAIFRPLVL